jgi:outer membrane protein
MNNKFLKYLFAIIFLILFLNFHLILAQANNGTGTSSSDSLSLNEIIRAVIQSHPSIKQASEAVKIADAKIGLAQSGYYPFVDITSSYTRLGPTSEFDLSHFGMGVMQLYPLNNYNASINLKETVYDFGKTAVNVDFENENKNLAEKSIEQVKQKLSLAAINNYYALLFLQEAIKIKDEQLNNLNDHLEFIKKKLLTGSAIQYEILSTEVKISTAESQKIDLLTAQKVQLSVLNSLMGTPESNFHLLKMELNAPIPTISIDSMFSLAYNLRDDMIMANEKIRVAELNRQFLNTKDNPELSIFGSGGWKNGYIPDLNKMTSNYVAGISLTIPLFDAFRTKNNVLLAESLIEADKFESEVIKRNIDNEIVENDANISSALKKVGQFELQVQHAKEAFELAKINYKAGAITNMDLLDAETTVSESNLLLLKARIDYTLSIYRLKAALGERLY